MTMTVRIFSADGQETRTVVPAAPIETKPSDRVQILIDGAPIDPNALERALSGLDLTVSLPGGGQITLLNFVDLRGDAGGGLVGSEAGEVIVASTIEALSAPAAGSPVEPGGTDLSGGSNLSTFNQASISEFAAFGAGAGGEGPDFDSPPADPLDAPDSFEVILVLQEAVAPEAPVPVEAAAEPLVIVEAVAAETPVETAEATETVPEPVVVVVPPPPIVGPPEAVEDSAVQDENAILLQPLMLNLLDNDLDPGSDGLLVEEILPGGVSFTMPANTMITNEVDNALGAGELVNKDVTLAQDISTPFFTLFDDIGRFNLTVLENGTATVTVLDGNPFGAMGSGESFDITFEYQLLDGLGETDTAAVLLSVPGLNEIPVAKDVNLIGYENEFAFGFPVLNTSLPVTDEETILENLSIVLNGQGTLPPEAGITIGQPFGFPPDVLGFAPTAIDDDALLTGASTYTVSDSEGIMSTADLMVTLRGNADLSELVGSDNPMTVDVLVDNADFLTTRASVLRGLAGDDNLFGENGADTLFGGSGGDFIFSGSEGDTAFGDEGNDFVFGDGGDDTVYGGTGDDQLDGSGDADSLFGGIGDDTLLGGDNFDFGSFMFIDQPDLLAGGPGNDSITVSGAKQGAVDHVVWQAGDADGSTDRVTGFDNDATDQDLLDLSAVLSGVGGIGGSLSDFLTVSNDGASTTIQVDADGLVGGASVDLTIILTDIGDGTLANLTDNILV